MMVSKKVFYVFSLILFQLISCRQNTKKDSSYQEKKEESNNSQVGIQIISGEKAYPQIKLPLDKKQVDIGALYTGITIYAHGETAGNYFRFPGELLITDPEGRKTGLDPTSGQNYQEIPESIYCVEAIGDVTTGERGPETKVIEIRQPAEGEYELKITGTAAGEYTLEIYATDRENKESGAKFLKPMTIFPGEVYSYLMKYSPRVGSKTRVYGAFDGKGQRPRDVNEFLSYSHPLQTTSELPLGETSYCLMIFYDQAIIPSTFRTELNGREVTSLFSVAPGSFEQVKLNLAQGRNTLLLKVDGALSSGRIATDQDRLTFIVK